MKLVVKVLEARNLRAMDLNGLSDPYVRVQVGKRRLKSKVVKKSLNPVWGEDLCLQVDHLNVDLVVSVLDEDRYFNDDFVGYVKLPLTSVFDSPNKTLPPSWYTLLPKKNKSKIKNCGEILFAVSFAQNNSLLDDSLTSSVETESNEDLTSESSISFDSPSRPSFAMEIEDTIVWKSPSNFLPPPKSLLPFKLPVKSRSSFNIETEDTIVPKEDTPSSNKFPWGFVERFLKNGETAVTTNKTDVVPELPKTPDPQVPESLLEDMSSPTSFEQVITTLELKDQGGEVPTNLPGGILLDKHYAIAPADLNSLFFSPDSNFTKSLMELQGTTEMQQGPWIFENGGDRLKRNLTYLKAATKLIKVVKAIEEQTYLKGDGKVFAVLISVSTPDVIYGHTFKVELLYCITPGPEGPTGEKSSRLVVSWRVNFLQSIMMKGMIEGGARQCLKSSFEQVEELLSQHVKPLDLKNLHPRKSRFWLLCRWSHSQTGS